jgi:hypothetical protein
MIHLAAISVAAMGVGVVDLDKIIIRHVVRVGDVILPVCGWPIDNDVTGPKAADEPVNAGCILRA